MGNDQAGGGEHRRMGCGGEDSVDRLGFVVLDVAEGIIIVCRGGRGCAPGCYCQRSGDITFSRRGVQLEKKGSVILMKRQRKKTV